MATRPDLGLLVERARAGDALAWEQLYRSLYPRLLAYARRQLDHDRAADAVGETMTRAVAGLARFEWRGAGFEGWLFGILRHVVTDAHRRAGRDARLRPLPDPCPGDVSADGLLHDDELLAVRSAFAQLSPEDQELLHLRVVSGLSADQVAAVLGKRPGAVRTAQSRALQRLRLIMGEVAE